MAALSAGCVDEAPLPTEPRILAGTAAQGGAYQAVFTVYNDADETRCTGTLVAAHTIVTAAHCVTVTNAEGVAVPRPASAFTVSNDDTELVGSDGIEVVEVEVHADYEPARERNDIAVLRLAESGIGHSNGHLIRPARVFPEAVVGLGGGIDLVGYGVNDNPQAPVGPNLPTVGLRMHVVHEVHSIGCAPNTACEVGDDYINWDNGSGGGTCSGDSGGPLLVFVNDDGEPVPAPPNHSQTLTPPPGATILVGAVISWGEAIDCLSGQDHGARLDRARSLLDRHVADLDGDGTVSFADFQALAAAFGSDDVEADLDGDGTVAYADFMILSGVFGL